MKTRRLGGSGYKFMQPKPGSSLYTPSRNLQKVTLPSKVDLRKYMTPVEDQGDTNSCTANAVAGAYEYWVKKASGKNYDASRLFIYYNARWRADDTDVDEGSVIQYAMEGLTRFGVCMEGNWPFQKKLVTKKPNSGAYKEGSKFCIRDTVQVPVELDAWKSSLADGLPIVFGCATFESFHDCTDLGGVVPVPKPKELQNEDHGLHAMCCVGYSDAEKIFIVRNSWGDDWGDRGYCYIPYSYLMNAKFNNDDCWTFIPQGDLPNSSETWSEDARPVTNGGRGVNFVIEQVAPALIATISTNLFKAVTVSLRDEIPAQYAQYFDSIVGGHFDALEDFLLSTVLGDSDESGDEEEGEEEEEYEEEDDEEYEEDEEDEEDEEEEEDDEEEYEEEEEDEEEDEDEEEEEEEEEE
ncbi:MAG: C1 family peptidase [Alphaproteobacteria bacterium]|nr:C1 family peptidase [Alphaproteobacteria bacterium]